MKYLILGGNGFIGKSLSEFLVEKGESVYVFDINYPEEKQEKVNYIQGDFFEIIELEKWIKQADIVIHAVSTINPSNSNQMYMRGYERDFLQTIRICELIDKFQKKMIFLSSGGTVYGEQVCQPIREDVTPLPINHYGNVKLCIENCIRVFARQNKSKMYIARIANPYGEGQDYRKGVGFIDAVIKKTMQNETIEVWGDGNVIRDYIYITDVCKMLYAICNYDGNEDVFNVSSGVGVSQRDILKIVNSILGNVKVNFLDSRSVDVKRVVLDNTKVQELCNMQCVSIEAGIKKYISKLE